MNCIRTDSGNRDFQELVTYLDKDLSIRDGNDHAFYAQFNRIDMIKHVVVAYQNGFPVACGAIKEYDEDTMEVKRMYTVPDYRGKGFATIIIKELENWASELNYSKCILETGIKQPEAIALYEKNQYQRIPNYGQYTEVKTSVCFQKIL